MQIKTLSAQNEKHTSSLLQSQQSDDTLRKELA